MSDFEEVTSLKSSVLHIHMSSTYNSAEILDRLDTVYASEHFFLILSYMLILERIHVITIDIMF